MDTVQSTASAIGNKPVHYPGCHICNGKCDYQSEDISVGGTPLFWSGRHWVIHPNLEYKCFLCGKVCNKQDAEMACDSRRCLDCYWDNR